MSGGRESETENQPQKTGDEDRHDQDRTEYVAALNEIKQAYVDAHKDDQSRDFWKSFREYLGIGLVLLTATFTGLSYMVFYRSMKDNRDIAQKQRAISTDTERRQLRAYVETQSAGAPTLVAGQPATITFIDRNTGLTPAYHVTPRLIIQMRPYPPLRLEVYAQPERGGLFETVINPGRADTFQVVTEESLTNAQVSQIKDGSTHRLFIHGTVFYVDAFGFERHTKVCEIIGGRHMKSAEFCPDTGAD